MKVSRHSLIFGLSYALDIAGKNNLSHSKSTAYVSVMMGRELGISEDMATSLYYAALLHDIGVSIEYDMLSHCKIGYEMLKELPLPPVIADYVLYHHEYYNGAGLGGLAGEDIPEGSQIICFASAFDDFYGKKAAEFDRNLSLSIKEWLYSVREMFSEKIIRAFESLLIREAFLLDYFNYETKYNLSQKIKPDGDIFYGYAEVLKFAMCFARIIDRRSPFTSAHSISIAAHAKNAAAFMKYDAETQDKMYLAGLLHDIGKLYVPVGILHKSDKLNPDERFEINKHTYFTRKILEQIDGLEDIVNLAANHHERVDGNGYPYHIDGSQMSGLEKMMAVCDVYQALTEERPYRESLPKETVWRIMDGMVKDKHLDGKMTEMFMRMEG